jgi:hypothetical protein
MIAARLRRTTGTTGCNNDGPITSGWSPCRRAGKSGQPLNKNAVLHSNRRDNCFIWLPWSIISTSREVRIGLFSSCAREKNESYTLMKKINCPTKMLQGGHQKDC